MVDRDTHKLLGYNFRMGEINAAIGRIQLKKLKKINNKRIQNSLYLLKKLKNLNKEKKCFLVKYPIKTIFHTYFWCPIRITSKKISLSQSSISRTLLIMVARLVLLLFYLNFLFFRFLAFLDF